MSIVDKATEFYTNRHPDAPTDFFQYMAHDQKPAISISPRPERAAPAKGRQPALHRTQQRSDWSIGRIEPTFDENRTSFQPTFDNSRE